MLGGLTLAAAAACTPKSVLADPALRELIDFSQPTGLLMTAVVHFVGDEYDPWRLLARYLDGAGYDLMFFADVTGLRSPWNGSYQLVAEQGMQIPTNDPSVLISALATATRNLGLVYTSSIAQAQPTA